MVDYNASGEIACGHPGWTNVMMNIPRVPREEVLYRSEGRGSRGRRAMWRPEQKNVSWMKDLVGKFTRGRDVVMDFCTGTYPTAKTSMLLDQHRKFVGCDLDSDLLMAAKPDLLLTFALQVLNPKSDITGDEEVRAAARAFKEKVAVVSARRRATAWEAPPGLDATQMMPRHVLHFICTLYEKYGLYEKCRHIPLSMRSSA